MMALKAPLSPSTNPFGNAFHEVVEDFLPPAAEHGNRLGQIFFSGHRGSETPGREKSSGLLSVLSLTGQTGLLAEAFSGAISTGFDPCGNVMKWN
jgi:hypothetical protein